MALLDALSSELLVLVTSNLLSEKNDHFDRVGVKDVQHTPQGTDAFVKPSCWHEIAHN